MIYRPYLLGSFGIVVLGAGIMFWPQSDHGVEEKHVSPKIESVQVSSECLPAFTTDNFITVDLGIAPAILAERAQDQVILNIPEPYIPPRNRTRYRNAQLDGAALLYAKLPDFGEYPSDDMGNPQAVGADAQVRILISTFVELEDVLDASIKVWGRSEKPASEVPKNDFDFDLTKIEYDIFGGQGHETFYHADGQDVSDVFTCSVGYKYNSCSHNFDAGNVEVKLSYRKSNLSDWQTIRRTAQSLVDCFGANSKP